MSVAQLHALGPVSLSTTVQAATPVVFGGITAASVTTNTTILTQVENGEQWSTYAAVVSQKPRMTFTSRDIVTVLSTIGVGGYLISSDGDDFGLRLAFRKRSAIGTASGSVHRTATMGSGILYATRLSCEHQGNAHIMCEAMPVSADGSTDSITLSDTGALGTVATATRDDQYTLYSVNVGGAAVTGFTGVDVDFGIRSHTAGAQSEFLDTITAITGIEPVITIRGIDLTWSKNAAAVAVLAGEAITLGNTDIVFKNRSSAISNSVHVQLTMNGVVYPDVVADASGEGDGTCSIVLRGCSSDGATAPMVVSTTYSYP